MLHGRFRIRGVSNDSHYIQISSFSAKKNRKKSVSSAYPLALSIPFAHQTPGYLNRLFQSYWPIVLSVLILCLLIRVLIIKTTTEREEQLHRPERAVNYIGCPPKLLLSLCFILSFAPLHFVRDKKILENMTISFYRLLDTKF